jgi:hypothetical protein
VKKAATATIMILDMTRSQLSEAYIEAGWKPSPRKMAANMFYSRL